MKLLFGAGSNGSPESRHAVGVELRINADQWHAFEKALSRQQTVKGVFMVFWQQFNMGGVPQFDGKQVEAIAGEFPTKQDATRFGQAKLASHRFDGDFPTGSHAYEFVVDGVEN
jgi:hypothetical protein